MAGTSPKKRRKIHSGRAAGTREKNPLSLHPPPSTEFRLAATAAGMVATKNPVRRVFDFGKHHWTNRNWKAKPLASAEYSAAAVPSPPPAESRTGSQAQARRAGFWSVSVGGFVRVGASAWPLTAIRAQGCGRGAPALL